MPKHAERCLRRAAHHRLGAETVGLAQHDRDRGNRQVGTGDEQPAAVAHERRRLDVGPDHHPRRVDERHERQVEGVAQLHEAGRLVGCRRVDRPAEMPRVVGEDADRAALEPGQRGDHAEAEVAPQLEHRADVEEQLDRAPDVVHAQAIDRHDAPAVRPGRRTTTRRAGPGSTTDSASPRRRRRPRRRTTRSTTPFARWTSIGPIDVGSWTPSPPPSIIAGPPMPMFESSVAMTTSQQPSSAALPAKQ